MEEPEAPGDPAVREPDEDVPGASALIISAFLL